MPDWDNRKLKFNGPNSDELSQFFQNFEFLKVQLECFFFKVVKVFEYASVFDKYLTFCSMKSSDIKLPSL
jgi:hypothetical protein